jgi:hypothetical protein
MVEARIVSLLKGAERFQMLGNQLVGSWLKEE